MRSRNYVADAGAILAGALLTIGMLGGAAPALAAAPAPESEWAQATDADAPSIGPASPPSATIGQPYSFGFEWTGAGIHAASQLPAGLKLSSDGVLWGTPSHQGSGVYTFTLSAYSDPIEDDEWPETVQRTFTMQISGDTHTAVIFDEIITVLNGHKWVAECPEGYWLDKRIGTAGRTVGQGLIVEAHNMLPVNEDPFLRVKQDGFVRATAGTTWNGWTWEPQPLKITMVCTNDLTNAWAG